MLFITLKRIFLINLKIEDAVSIIRMFMFLLKKALKKFSRVYLREESEYCYEILLPCCHRVKLYGFYIANILR